MAQAVKKVTPQIGEAENWQGLRLVNAYRVLLAFGLVTAAVTGFGPKALGQHLPHLFGFTAWLYLIIAIAYELLLELRIVSYKFQVHLHSISDITILLLLLHSTGGAVGGVVGLLLVVAVALSAALLQGRMALFYAALATLGVLGQTTLAVIKDAGAIDSGHFTAAGALGIALFTITGLVASQSRRAAGLQQVNAQREMEIARISELSMQILEQFGDGVLVVDQQGQIEYANSAALHVLALELSGQQPRRLDSICKSLDQQFRQWLTDPASDTVELSNPFPIRVHFKALTGQRALIVLTDQRLALEQARQTKLAALGRLTASIAHEIRNPLSSIQHAAQLLSETNQDPQNTKLAGIVVSHAQRINQLVSNVLDVARQPVVNPLPIDLGQWLSNYVDTSKTHWPANTHWEIQLPPEPVIAMVDPTHLAQILDNLISNSLEHGRDELGEVHLRLGVEADDSNRALLWVADSGPGIAEEQLEKIFVPFFTTSARGTGLGLYISRELAQANQGKLTYEPDKLGSRFTLTLRLQNKES
ncbi:MAG TPA: PAS domain-containing protein [Halothiobacillus sp.]|nr:PAS domain-containing protein [Halothiobacillus sp.]